MAHTLTIEVPNAFADAWRKLPPERQASLVDYASYLAAQEEAGHRIAEDEAGWEHRFSDPVSRARFLAWGREALSGPGDEPLELQRL